MTWYERVLKNSDIVVGVIIISVVLMLVLPIPWQLLDVFLTFNISFAILILMASMLTSSALEFSVFPSLLLIMTLFRLSLNVGSTKLVLLDAYAGEVIQQFGNFVVGGNTVVGLVVFLILVVIQFIVITRGAERVSEVAARFTLDAMPGKQMAIDADLNSGLINEQQARERRQDIQREADFYGAMDGASKFVKGDAIAGIIIIIINIVGGFIIGMAQKGMALTDALHTYTILTVGDGLVTQIPALLISTATGIIVTRSADKSNLGHEVTSQLFAYPKALYIAGVVVIILGMFGLPKVPMFTAGCLFILLGFFLSRSRKETEPEVQEEIVEAETMRKAENVVELLQIDKMEIELGYALIPLVDSEQGGDLLDRIIMIRRQNATELGFIVPPIRIRDNMQLKPSSYVIKIKGVKVAGSDLMLDRYLVIGAGIEYDGSLPGIDTTEPAFGLPARWVDISQKDQAEAKGYTVVDPPSVLATHLTQVIKTHAHELLGRQDVQGIIDFVKQENSAVVDELIPDMLSLGDVQKVLGNLLKEGIPIRDMVTILEALADYAKITRDDDVLTEYVRQALRRHITKLYAGDDHRLEVLTLDPSLEDYMRNSLQSSEFGSYLALDPDRLQKLVNQLEKQSGDILARGQTPIIVCAPVLRIHFKRLLERFIPGVVVLSYNELESDIQVDVVGMIAA
ncbi:MAG: flagellar biosynthesis protein FlhA [Methylocystaceae bacterium]